MFIAVSIGKKLKEELNIFFLVSYFCSPINSPKNTSRKKTCYLYFPSKTSSKTLPLHSASSTSIDDFNAIWKQFFLSKKPQPSFQKLVYHTKSSQNEIQSRPEQRNWYQKRETFLYQFPFLLTFLSIYRSYRIIKVIMLTDVNNFEEEKRSIRKKSCSLKIIGWQ